MVPALCRADDIEKYSVMAGASWQPTMHSMLKVCFLRRKTFLQSGRCVVHARMQLLNKTWSTMRGTQRACLLGYFCYT